MTSLIWRMNCVKNCEKINEQNIMYVLIKKMFLFPFICFFFRCIFKLSFAFLELREEPNCWKILRKWQVYNIYSIIFICFTMLGLKL